MKIIISPYPQKLHGTDKKNPKCYPHWKELISLLKDHDLVQVGIEGEEQLVDRNYTWDGGQNGYYGVSGFSKNLSFKDLKTLLFKVDTFISIDNFFQHFAHLYGKRGIVIWGQSDPKLFGYHENINLLKHEKYLRKNQYGTWHECEYNEDAFIDPLEIFNKISEFK